MNTPRATLIERSAPRHPNHLEDLMSRFHRTTKPSPLSHRLVTGFTVLIERAALVLTRRARLA